MDPSGRRPSPPDFLVKLLQMLKEEDSALIHWNGGTCARIAAALPSNVGKLHIHDPQALERKMSVYFR